MGAGLKQAAAILCVSVGATIIAVRLLMAWLSRAGVVQPVRHEDCPPLQAVVFGKQGTPTMGGLAVISAAVGVAVGFSGLSTALVAWLLTVIVGFSVLGGLDDWLKLKGKNGLGLRSLPKFWLAMMLSAFFALGSWYAAAEPLGLEVPGLGWVHLNFAAWIIFVMLVMTSTAHAVNLTDGMDGLAVGTLAVSFAVLACWNTLHVPTQWLVPWCLALAGACVGFLWHNGYPAAIFLGDIGALGLGAALGAISLLSGAGLWLVLIGLIFVCEAGSVILQVGSYRLRHGKRIFRVAPLHHHFHVGGISEPRLVVRFWIIALLCGTLALALRGI